ncbi:hypothetical protein [Streptomyces chartreusis]|uniref:hypothetical protein n=1 Tax=Streptomyces chartreusis TaxID=1969 RepID=UPI0036CF8942
MEAALVAESLLNKTLADGHFGTATVDAYAAWQRRCGRTGHDADGTPGIASLTTLLCALEAVRDNAELISWMPPGLSPFGLALVPTTITFVSGWVAKDSPRRTVQ